MTSNNKDIDSDLIGNEEEVEIEICDDAIDGGRCIQAIFEDEQEDFEDE